jgi:hypothetical protein
MLFAAVHESASGTKRTIAALQHFVRYWTRADKLHGVFYEYTPFRCYLMQIEAQREIRRSCPAIVYYLRHSP